MTCFRRSCRLLASKSPSMCKDWAAGAARDLPYNSCRVTDGC